MNLIEGLEADTSQLNQSLIKARKECGQLREAGIEVGRLRERLKNTDENLCATRVDVRTWQAMSHEWMVVFQAEKKRLIEEKAAHKKLGKEYEHTREHLKEALGNEVEHSKAMRIKLKEQEAHLNSCGHHRRKAEARLKELGEPMDLMDGG